MGGAGVASRAAKKDCRRSGVARRSRFDPPRAAGWPAPPLHRHVRGRAGRAPAPVADLPARHPADRVPGDEAHLLRALLLRTRDLRSRRVRRTTLRAGEVRARVAPMIHAASDRDVVVRPDVCIVGSGPGGAMVASRLARAGASVVVLEEGGYHTKDEFDMQEATAFPRLYQDRGNRATADLSVQVLQGRAVGGGTVVNW